MSSILPRYKNNKVSQYSTTAFIEQHQPELLKNGQKEIEGEKLKSITYENHRANFEIPLNQNEKLFSPNMLLSGHSDEITSIAFSSDGNFLCSGGKDRKMLLWKIGEKCPNYGMYSNHKNCITDIKFTKDGNNIVTASADTFINYIDLFTLKTVRKFKGHENIVNCIDTNKNGSDLIVSGSNDRLIKLWDPLQKREIQSYFAKYPVLSLVFKNTHFFSGGLDNTIKEWDININQEINTLKGHTDSITSLNLSHEKSYILSSSMDNSLKIWDIMNVSKNGNAIKTFKGVDLTGKSPQILRSSWNYNGRYISSGSSDGNVYIWNTNNKKIVGVLGGHQGSVNSVSFHPRTNIIASCSADHNIILTELPDNILN